MQLELLDSRRLTGPSLYWHRPGAIIDVALGGVDAMAVVTRWQQQLRAVLDGVGWTGEACCYRLYDGGASLVMSAPIDALYAATEVNEAAWQAACALLNGRQAPDFAATVAVLRRTIADEANPALLNLQHAAAEHACCWLSDDDQVSLGSGQGARIWPVNELPSPDTLAWDQISDIPLALITGTNGKSTTVRVADAIIKAAGLTPGVTSTDYIRVGEQVLDHGDYSGPGGARTLLRHPQVEIALLEVARGGMLRRGLATTQASAALITNVAADHLGEYGINTVAELIEAKFIVHKAIRPDQPLILNADDGGVVDYAARLESQRIIWFSEHADNPLIQRHWATGKGEAMVVDAGHICWRQGTISKPIIAVEQVPLTLGGAARHNVQNCLAAAALCKALGIGSDAIAKGLRGFAGTPEENPGRGNLFSGQGLHVLVDFAHNEHGVKAVIDTIRRIPAQRRLVLMGQAGDRSDAAIQDLVNAVMTAHPDALVVCELPGYERGRASGEVSALIEGFAIASGMEPTNIIRAANPAEGVEAALNWSRPGDFLLLLTLTQRDQAISRIREFLG